MLSPEEWSAVGLSLRVSAWAVVLGLPPAVAVAYALARGSLRTRWALDTFVNLPLVLPPVVTGYLLLVLLGRHGPLGAFVYNTFGLRIAFTWQAAAIAAGVVGFPLMVRAIRLAFQTVDPRLEAAARSLGASPINAFFTVTLPLSTRGIVAGAVLGFARGLGEFGATIVVAGNIPGITQTLPLAIYSRIQHPGGIAGSWRLVALSVALACLALAAGEWLEHRERRRHA
ncbi:MAG: molybdate ABC transporter permease subunit [FCB group bacterium]|jgi:molybdate transport system permease protein|nr:molybdate ABC transporter permease subunit [FCB group bacterium]